MKKLFLFFFAVLGSLQTANSQIIEQITVSSTTGSNDLNIYVKSFHHYLNSSNSSNYSIVDNTIIVTICFNPSALGTTCYIENNIIIPNLNNSAQNYSVVVNLHFYSTTLGCNTPLQDTEVLSFATPLSNPVSLATTNQIKESNVAFFPNLGHCPNMSDLGQTRWLLKGRIHGGRKPVGYFIRQPHGQIRLMDKDGDA